VVITLLTVSPTEFKCCVIFSVEVSNDNSYQHVLIFLNENYGAYISTVNFSHAIRLPKFLHQITTPSNIRKNFCSLGNKSTFAGEKEWPGHTVDHSPSYNAKVNTLLYSIENATATTDR